MKFELHSATWGAWHTDMFLTVALPTLLAEKNLPALSAGHEVVYRIYTTPKWARYLDAHPIMERVRSILTVEYVLYRNDENYGALNHMDIWHDAAAHAKSIDAILVVIPPDTIWPNCVFANALKALQTRNTSCVAVPYMLTVSETSVPALHGSDRDSRSSDIISIGPRELMKIVVEHYHPHLMILGPDNPHGRPPLELMWPVGKEGFVVRCYVRELFMVDLSRVELTEHFYGQTLNDPEQYYLMRDSDEGYLVGLHALLKYSYVAHPNRPLQPVDIAACSLVGANRAPLAWETGRDPIIFHTGSTNTALWRKVSRGSFLFYFEAMVLREIMMIREALVSSDIGHGAARILALVIQATDIGRKWRSMTSSTILVPSDHRWQADHEEAWWALCLPGHEADLICALKQYVVPQNFDPDALAEGQSVTLKSLGDREFTLSRRNGTVEIDGTGKVSVNTLAGEAEHRVLIFDPLDEAVTAVSPPLPAATA